MNKRYISDEEDLQNLWDWAISEFPHSTIQPPDELPALFIWTSEYSGLTGGTILYTWVYEGEI